MTDVLDRDDLLSTQEVRPKITIVEETAQAVCPDCGASFKGPLRNAALGRHRSSKHGIKGQSDRNTRRTAPKSGQRRPRRNGTARPASSPTAGAASVPSRSRRRPLGQGIADVIEKVAQMAGNVNPATGNALVFAAPALGNSVDGVVAGTFVDKRLLQPAAAGSEKWGKLAGAAGLPMMVFAISMQPALAVVLESELRRAMVVCLRERVTTLKRQRAEERKVTDALEELAELDPELAKSPDPIGLMLQQILAPILEGQAAGEPSA